MMRRRNTLTIILSAVIVVLVVAVGVLFWQYKHVKSGDQAKQTSARIIREVSNLYLVPTGEEPTVAQIQDKSKLGNQEFFKATQNGDYLLVYQKAKVALVYRENVNKLINVGPVNLGNQNNQNSSSQSGQTAGAETNTPSH